MDSPPRKRFFSFKNRRRLPGLLAFLVAALARVLRWTYRIKIVDPVNVMGGSTWPVIFVLWHNRIPFLAGGFPRHMCKRVAVMISASRDGEYATTFIRHFGLQVVRGSSSRRGAQALRELKRALDDGVAAVLTLDGSRGPRYEVQPGVALLSYACSVPVVPVSMNAPSRWEFRSWDRTQIPKPFSRVEVRIGTPVSLPQETGGKERRDVLCALLRDALMDVTDDEMR